MLKLLALGTLGYVAYVYMGRANRRSRSEVRLAGGPLSDQATIQSNPDEPPVTH